MQQAPPSTDGPSSTSAGGSDVGQAANRRFEKARDLVAANAVVVFARDDCCMCHVIKLLLHGHGVSPKIRLVSERDEADVKREFTRYLRRKDSTLLPQFPAIFVCGELFGGLDEIMGAHISGELVPKLRAARALWL